MTLGIEDLEAYENHQELALFREYRDVVSIFKYVVETDRRFYLANQVDVQMHNNGGDVFFARCLGMGHLSSFPLC